MRNKNKLLKLINITNVFIILICITMGLVFAYKINEFGYQKDCKTKVTELFTSLQESEYQKVNELCDPLKIKIEKSDYIKVNACNMHTSGHYLTADVYVKAVDNGNTEWYKFSILYNKYKRKIVDVALVDKSESFWKLIRS